MIATPAARFAQRPAAAALGLALLTAAPLSSASAQCPPELFPDETNTGTNGPVYAMTIWDPDGAGPVPPLLVVGGSFTTAGGMPVNRIVTWNPATGGWMALGSSLRDRVLALTVMPNGDLIAGGHFTFPPVWPETDVVRWTGDQWLAVGSGMYNTEVTSEVRALAVMPNGDLVAAGDFTFADGIMVRKIARWNAGGWTALGGGFDPYSGLSSLAVLPNGDLIAAGSFTNAAGVPANNIAHWNGSTWSALGSGVDGGVSRMVVMPNGDLIAAGWFTHAGGVPANHIARWDGTAWSALGLGVDHSVSALALLPTGGLIAGGWFTTPAGYFAGFLTRWNGVEWSAPASGANGGVNSVAVLPSGLVAVGGEFTTVNGHIAPHFALAAFSPCLADFDCNHAVEPADVTLFVQTWLDNLQAGGLTTDFDHNGAVDPVDISAFVTSWISAVTSGC